MKLSMALVFTILLLPLSGFVQAADLEVTPQFKFQSTSFVRVVAAATVLRHPLFLQVRDSDLSDVDLEKSNRIRVETLKIVGGLPYYRGLHDFAADFVKSYEERLADWLPQSRSEDWVYAWALAYRKAYGRGFVFLGLLPETARPIYQRSLEQVEAFPSVLSNVENPEMSQAQLDWVMNQAYKQAYTLREEAEKAASKPLDCQTWLQTP